jgi:hypothetical protein
MTRVCTVCNHPEAFEINEKLIVEGASVRDIAGRYGLEKSTVQRHKDHIPQLLVKASEAQQVADADALLDQVKDLQGRTLDILSRAEDQAEDERALKAVREVRSNIELLARLAGELKEGTTINLTMHPEWIEIRTVLVQVLDSYPAAKQAVADALGELEEGERRALVR